MVIFPLTLSLVFCGGILLLGALLAAGVAALRREIVREFPDAGDDDATPPPAPAPVTQAA